MELWDLYDENRIPTGETHVRGERIPEGSYHLVVHVWIRNERGEYLISRRSASRPTYPLLWECVGGSVLAGEDSRSAALRETLEEVGIRLPARGGRGRLYPPARQGGRRSVRGHSGCVALFLRGRGGSFPRHHRRGRANRVDDTRRDPRPRGEGTACA